MRRTKWSRGFFRLWLIASFILVTILFIANRPILNFIQHVEGKNEYTKALNAIEVPEGTYDFNGAIREGLETADLVDYFSSDTELSALVSNIEVFEEEISVDSIYECDELWLTSSTKEIQPVAFIDDYKIPTKKSEQLIWNKALKLFNLY